MVALVTQTGTKTGNIITKGLVYKVKRAWGHEDGIPRIRLVGEFDDGECGWFVYFMGRQIFEKVTPITRYESTEVSKKLTEEVREIQRQKEVERVPQLN